MASLQSRISDLITAIGADIKALKAADQARANASTSAQASAFSADTMVAGSVITFPAGKIKAGTIYRCKFEVVKTAAGAAAPVITVRVGTLGTTADAARATLTFAAQTAVADEGVFEVDCVFRSAGATAVIQAMGTLVHRLVTTGLNVTGVFTKVLNTSASFDVTTATSIGLSAINSASTSWTVSLVEAELINLTP